MARARGPAVTIKNYPLLAGSRIGLANLSSMFPLPLREKRPVVFMGEEPVGIVVGRVRQSQIPSGAILRSEAGHKVITAGDEHLVYRLLGAGELKAVQAAIAEEKAAKGSRKS